MRVRVRVAAEARASPEAVFAWWTDYRTDDHAGPAFLPFGWTSRRILDRDGLGRVVRFRDEGSPFGQDTSYESRLSYDPPHAVRETSEGAIGPFETEYAFAPAPTGTRIVMTLAGRVVAPWARPWAALPGLAAALAWADLRGHVAELHADLRAASLDG